MTATADKIYIQLLDGSTAYVPINARQITDNKYEILADSEYTDYVDALYLFEFYPGDIVELSAHTFSGGTAGQVATKLVKQGQWQDRKFNEFKFKATLGQLSITKQIADNYKEEIKRVINESKAGQFFYPTLLETTDKLSKLLA